MTDQILESFVDAAKAAEFLTLRPRRVLEMARAGELPAHPLGSGRRKTWRFLLSELHNHVRTGPAKKVFTEGASRGMVRPQAVQGAGGTEG
jgi:hypothetical protein